MTRGSESVKKVEGENGDRRRPWEWGERRAVIIRNGTNLQVQLCGYE